MAATVVRSFSKVNLGLRIGPPRADGFHSLVTLYQTVALHDLVTVEAEPAHATEIALTASDPRVPADARNTAYRMVQLALAAMKVQARVHIHLEKCLPPQGGMGAGSANAAAALLALERELRGWGAAPRPLTTPARLQFAAEVGSDVPLFLVGGAVYGHHRGEQVEPYADLPETACLVVAPGVGSSTPAAFRAWDARIAALTPVAAQGRLDELSRVYASAFRPGQVACGEASASDRTGSSGVSGAIDRAAGGNFTAKPGESGDLAENPLLALVRTGIENDFEEVVFQQHPSLREIKHALSGTQAGETASLVPASPAAGGALCAMLSGSGSSLFGLYASTADAEAAERRVQALGMSGVRCFQTHTIGREAYWRTMFVQ